MKHRRLFLSLVGTVIVVAGVSGILIKHYSKPVPQAKPDNNSQTEQKIDYSPARPSDNAANNSRKEGSNSVEGTTLNGTNTPPTSTGTVSITRAYIDNEQKILQVGSLVSGTTSGRCTLTASKNGQTDVVAYSTISQNVNSYGCANFNVPFSQFPVAGEWTVKVALDNGASDKWPTPVTIPDRQ